MFENIENLKIIASFHRASKPILKIDCRKTNVFLLRIKGSVLYDFYGKKMLARKDDIIFIPKGAPYTAKSLSDNCMYTSIHFDADFTEPQEAACFSLADFYEADYIKNCFSDMWNFGTQSEKYHCMSVLYSLFSYLSMYESNSGYMQEKFDVINPAIDYLREHIYDSELKVDKLHRLCGISNTYFRQLFTLKFGTNPQNYITAKRISHAKTIIKSGDFNTINEVALSAGFSDALYFSQVFKKICGMPPSKMNKL